MNGGRVYNRKTKESENYKLYWICITANSIEFVHLEQNIPMQKLRSLRV